MTPPKPPLPITRLTLLLWYGLLIAGIALPPLWLALAVWVTVVMRRHGRNKRALEARWRHDQRLDRAQLIRRMMS